MSNQIKKKSNLDCLDCEEQEMLICLCVLFGKKDTEYILYYLLFINSQLNYV